MFLDVFEVCMYVSKFILRVCKDVMKIFIIKEF